MKAATRKRPAGGDAVAQCTGLLAPAPRGTRAGANGREHWRREGPAWRAGESWCAAAIASATWHGSSGASGAQPGTDAPSASVQLVRSLWRLRPSRPGLKTTPAGAGLCAAWYGRPERLRSVEASPPVRGPQGGMLRRTAGVRAAAQALPAGPKGASSRARDRSQQSGGLVVPSCVPWKIHFSCDSFRRPPFLVYVTTSLQAAARQHFVGHHSLWQRWASRLWEIPAGGTGRCFVPGTAPSTRTMAPLFHF